MWSESAEELLLGTAAHESHLGKYRYQVGGGPALGVYQMEPATLVDIYDNYLAFRPKKQVLVKQVTGVDGPDLYSLKYDAVYATVMARLHYWRVPEPLPPPYDIPALANYWDDHYNKNPAKGFPGQWIEDYQRLVLG